MFCKAKKLQVLNPVTVPTLQPFFKFSDLIREPVVPEAVIRAAEGWT